MAVFDLKTMLEATDSDHDDDDYENGGCPPAYSHRNAAAGSTFRARLAGT